jgi:hypothetical protein
VRANLNDKAHLQTRSTIPATNLPTSALECPAAAYTTCQNRHDKADKGDLSKSFGQVRKPPKPKGPAQSTPGLSQLPWVACDALPSLLFRRSCSLLASPEGTRHSPPLLSHLHNSQRSSRQNGGIRELSGETLLFKIARRCCFQGASTRHFALTPPR